MSSATGRQVDLLMSNPSTGSANPSASFSALWGYILPALDHIVRSPANAIDKAPAIDATYHMGIYTATYNYFTAIDRAVDKSKLARGTDLYNHLDRYYAQLARELFLNAPEDNARLVQYIISCFKRYSVGARSVSRLLDYVNRHYVKLAVAEDRGWLTLDDLFNVIVKSARQGDKRKKIPKRLKEMKVKELKKWGYEGDGSAESLALAERCAEAASSLDRIIHLEALALRRFRTELVEPLLERPKMKGSLRPDAAPVSDNFCLSESRLARTMQELLEVQQIKLEERLKLATDLRAALFAIGIRNNHSLRKRLDKFLATGTVARSSG